MKMESVPGADPEGITRIQMCDGDRGINTVDLPIICNMCFLCLCSKV